MLASTLARASDSAAAAGASDVSLEHLLAALCDDPDAVAVFDASRVDVERLRADVHGYLAHKSATAVPGAAGFSISQDFKRILEAAAAAAQGGRRRDINGAIVLAAIIGDGNSIAAQMLQAQGLTFDEVIRALQTALSQSAPRDVPAGIGAADDILARARERVQSRAAPTFRDIMNELPRPVPPPPLPPTGGPQPNVLQPGISQPSYPQPGLPEAKVIQPTFNEPMAARTPSQNDDKPALDFSISGPAPSAEPEALKALRETCSAPSSPDAFPVPPPRPPNDGGYAYPTSLPTRVLAPPASPDGGPMLPGFGYQPRPFPTALPPPIPGGGPGIGSGGPPGSGGFSGGSQLYPPMQTGLAPYPHGPSPALGVPAPQTSGLQAPQRGAPAANAKREARGKAESGQLAENIPRGMRVGKTERVEIRVAKAAAKSITEGLDGGGVVWRHDVTVTQAMSVRLRAPEGGFFIETVSPETQWIENSLGFASDDFASWRFLVTPQSRGWARLQIVVSARTVGADGMAAETALPDQVVEVKVRTNLKRTFVWLLGWIVAAVAGGAVARFGDAGIDAAKLLVTNYFN